MEQIHETNLWPLAIGIVAASMILAAPKAYQLYRCPVSQAPPPSQAVVNFPPAIQLSDGRVLFAGTPSGTDMAPDMYVPMWHVLDESGVAKVVKTEISNAIFATGQP